MLDPRPEMCNPLMIPELYYKVLDCYRQKVTGHCEGKKPLFALAQTCRTLSEPALDCLWRVQYSLAPLIRCYTSVDQIENTIPPTPSQFTVIDKYACRIRELTISDEASVRFLQCTSMRPSCLFPELMVLRWFPYLLPNIPIIFIQWLLSPTLISIQANLVEADGATLLSFLNNFPLLCRKLKSVKFCFSRPLQSEMIIQALSRAICSQKHLENVFLRAPVDHIALTYLCTLPTLKVLSIDLSDRSRLRTELVDPPFYRVKELEFSTSDLELVSSLLRPCDQMFRIFRLCCPSRQTLEAFVTFLNVLASRSRTNPLQSLFLSIGYTSGPMPADRMTSEAVHYCLSYVTLESLTVFGSLRKLKIGWGEQISLDDDELASLAGSWPFLEVFHIRCGRGGCPPSPTKHATLLGLLSLVNSCPKLHTLSLPLDAREVPEVEGTMTCKRRRFHLTAVESPINEARPVAEFLLKYLPSVTTVGASFLRPPGTNEQQIIAYEEAWQQVKTHLEEFYSSPS